MRSVGYQEIRGGLALRHRTPDRIAPPVQPGPEPASAIQGPFPGASHTPGFEPLPISRRCGFEHCRPGRNFCLPVHMKRWSSRDIIPAPLHRDPAVTTLEQSCLDRGNPLIDTLADWLVDQALGDAPLEAIFEGTCKRLYAAGIPITRSYVTFRTLHPLYQAQALVWKRDSGLELQSYPHDATPEQWQKSPFFHMVEHDIPLLRRHLTGESAILDFEILEELADQGYTDYLAFMVKFDKSVETDAVGGGIVGSWSTERDNGFTNEDIRSLQRIEQRLGVAFKINIQKKLTENILAAYLGPGAGRQIMSGQIKRGDGETIRAVIWYSDMRDSTRLAASMTSELFLHALNEYFESTAGAVLQHQGEVLRFIGDAVLAIFPISDERDTRTCCRLAMEAARAAEQRMMQVNEARRERGEPELDFGLGLHVGDVLFGNIGVPERVEFSVVGPAANEVARLESLTKTVGSRILVSELFAENVQEEWRRMGEFAIPGMSNTVPAYALPADPAAL